MVESEPSNVHTGLKSYEGVKQDIQRLRAGTTASKLVSDYLTRRSEALLQTVSTEQTNHSSC